MANPEHLAILEQGVDAWNEWRHEPYAVLQKLGSWKDLTSALAVRSVADLSGADLNGANLCGVDLVGADLGGAELRGANLREAKLSMANLGGVDLGGANLSRSDLSWAHLTLTNLERADLSTANLRRAKLSEANLIDADLSHARVGWTVFADTDLSLAKGLEILIHSGPSTIGIDTIYRSRGNIPEVFLRGAGVPDSVIAYVRSRIGKPPEFYSCFISYSAKDEEFADRLYTDLQAVGVRCWFAPEDLKIGDPFRDRIDESIRLHDKLLLILSENSVQSPWVATEVEAAFERERRQQDRIVLFPVRLDDAVMLTHQAWAADVRRRRHIGNFSGWKDHDLYTNALKRLLRDLKAKPLSA